VLLRLNASKLLTFHIGPQFSVLTNNHKTTAGNVGDAFTGGDFAMVAGAQVNLGALKIYGRYNIGLNNINEIGDQEKWKNQQVQFGLGLRIL
ncbi:MAG TPA: PorT family protein, partial [Panacibacter sp.]|nr:PorT family protein [Panacibacter sp.]